MRFLPALAALFISAFSFAHPGHDLRAPVRPTDLLDHWGATRGGYGFVGPSEAESYWLLGLRCDPEAGVPLKCLDEFRGVSPETEYLAEEVLRQLLLERIRASAYEYLALQFAQLTGSRNRDFAPPACLAHLNRLKGLFASLPVKSPAEAELKKMSPQRRELLAKFSAVGGTLSEGNMLRSLIYHDHLQEAFRKRCVPEASEPICVEVPNQLQRLKDSIPVLFHGRPERAEARLAELRDSVHQVLGARAPGAKADRRAAGKAVYESFFSNIFNPSAGINLEKTLAERVDEARLQDPGTAAEVNRALADSVSMLIDNLRRLRSDFALQLRMSVDAICKEGLASLTEIAPNIVRQTMLDLKGSDRKVAKALLCRQGLMDRMAIGIQCQGFTSEKTPEGEVFRISQRRSHFPYGATVNYRLLQPPGGAAPRVELTVNVSSDLPAEELARTLESWGQKVSGWFNCQSGAAATEVGKCPPFAEMPKPPMRFAVRFQSVPADSKAEPLVKLSRCVRAELPADKRSDCKAAREFGLTSAWKPFSCARASGSAGRFPLWKGPGRPPPGNGKSGRYGNFHRET
jgi:hypothetical protein